jgi:hypothetical protein
MDRQFQMRTLRLLFSITGRLHIWKVFDLLLSRISPLRRRSSGRVAECPADNDPFISDFLEVHVS